MVGLLRYLWKEGWGWVESDTLFRCGWNSDAGVTAKVDMGLGKGTFPSLAGFAWRTWIEEIVPVRRIKCSYVVFAFGMRDIPFGARSLRLSSSTT